MPRKRKEEATVEPGKGLNLDPELIKQLVPGTLDRATINEQLAALKKAIFERALGGELTHHLGYEKGEAKPGGRTNHRNGTSRKRVATDDDLLDVEIPRDPQVEELQQELRAARDRPRSGRALLRVALRRRRDEDARAAGARAGGLDVAQTRVLGPAHGPRMICEAVARGPVGRATIMVSRRSRSDGARIPFSQDSR